MTPVRESVRWRSILLFLGVAFGVSWAVWIAMSGWNVPWWTGLAASWGPAIAALLLRGPVLKEGFRDSGLFTIGRGPSVSGAYVIALSLTAVAAVASTALGLAVGAFQLDWSLYRGLTSPNMIVVFVSDHFGLWACC